MNWDEKVRTEAIVRGLNAATLGPVRASIEQEMAQRWARWQREQLSRPEAVERVARALCDNDWSLQGDEEYHWEHFKDNYRATARAAIAALLGEDA